MTQLLKEADRGCLLLADIAGYTSYLQGSELEHAKDVLTDLLETIIDGSRRSNFQSLRAMPPSPRGLLDRKRHK